MGYIPKLLFIKIDDICKMEVYRAQDHSLNSHDIFNIITSLQNGAIAIFPTDSVYTIACAFTSNEGIEKLCKLVNKKPGKANLSLICCDFEMVSEYTLPFATSVFRLMKQSLPGPFTFILKANARKFRGYENKKATVGIRIPDEDFLVQLISKMQYPLVCSSLHSEDELLHYFSDPEEIENEFADKVDLFVDDGPGGFEPSTVIDCTGSEPYVLRQGKGVV